MVVGAFPVAKLGALLIKQISKPLASAIANQAKQHPLFSRVVCMPPAQCKYLPKYYQLLHDYFENTATNMA